MGGVFHSIFFGLLLTLAFTSFLLINPNKAHAAVFNDAADGNWNSGATWGNPGNNVAGSGYPGSADTVTIDSNVITLTADGAARFITISGGTLNGGSFNLSIGSSGSATWAYSSGTFNPQTGTVKFVSATTFTGNTTFNNLTIDPSTSVSPSYTFTGYNATTTGTFTMQNSGTGTITLVGGTIAAQGDVVWDAAHAISGNSQTTVLLVNGLGDQTITSNNATLTSGQFIALNINKPSGNLTLASGKIIRTDKNWTFTSMGTGSLITTGSTVEFAPSFGLTINITGSHTLNNLTFYANTSNSGNFNITITSGTTLTTTGAFILQNDSTGTIGVSTGSIITQGDISINTLAFSPSINLIINGSSNQALTLTGGSTTTGAFASTTITKTGGTLTVSGTLRTNKNFSDLSGSTDWTTNNSTLSFAGTSNFNPVAGNTYNNIYIDTVGAVTLQHDFSMAGNWTNNHNFTPGSNLVTFTGSSNSLITTNGTNATQKFNNLTINKTGSGVAQFASSTAVGSTLTITSGTLDLNGQNLVTTTNCSNSGTLKLTGDETLSCTPTLNAGSTVMYTATTTTRNIKNWAYKNLAINGSGGTFTDASSTRTLGEGLIVTAGTFTPPSTLTVTATTTINGGTFSAAGSTLNLNSDVLVSSGTFTAPSGTLNISGIFNHTGGIFTHSSGTVNLNGTNQSILGTNSFYNLTKSASVPRTLTFDHTATTTILNTLTLNGATGNLLSLRSDLDASAWKIDPQGSRTLSYLDVKDSNNVNSTLISLTGNNITLTGSNNTGWGAPADVTPPQVMVTVPTTGATIGGPSVTLTSTSTDNVGVVGVQFKLDTNTLIGTEGTTSPTSPYSISWDTTGVSEGAHTIIAVARDASGNYATSTAINITVDNTKPNITGVVATPSGQSAAIITWTTNEAASSQVYYGTTTPYTASTTLDSTATTTHSVNLSGLFAGTTYHFSVYSADSVGNLATSTDATFVTGDTTPPTVTLISPINTETVFGLQVYLSATSTDNIAVAGVQFKLDTNINIGSEITSAPYATTWDATALSGSHTIIAVARDASGNYATSTVATVTVSSSGAVYLPNGSGFGGVTAQPATQGNPGQFAIDATSTAHWDVVPYQTFSNTMNVGVVAFHSNGIQKVSFSVNGGVWTDVTSMTLNPETNVVEYWTTLRASDFPDGQIELRAIAYPYVGIPRVLESLYLNADSNSTLPTTIKYVSNSGSDTTGDGSSGNPYQTISKARDIIKAAQSNDVGGGVIYLKAGSYAYGLSSENFTAGAVTQWLTIQPAPGISRSSVIINSIGSSNGLRTDKVRLRNITLQNITLTSNGPEVDYLWFDGVNAIGQGRTVNAGFVDGSWTGYFVTQTHLSSYRDGFQSAILAQNSSVTDIGSDSFSNTALVVNVTSDNVDDTGTLFHPDVFQFYTTHNFILYNITAVDNVGAQGVFADGASPMTDVAMVNVNINNQTPVSRVFNVFQFLAPATNFYIKDSNFFGPAGWRTASGFTATNVVVENTTFSTFPGVVSGVTYRSSPADITPPMISFVASSTIQTTATITWTTNEPADSQIDYGTSISYTASTTLDSTATTTHSVNISSLSAGTIYHFQIRSADASGNVVTTSDATFTTASASDNTPPTPGSLTFSNINQTIITISSTGASDNVALATLPFLYHNVTSNTYLGPTSTPVTFTGLTPNTSYTFEIGVEDTSGNWATTTQQATTTLSNLVVTHIITSSAGSHGAISPSGAVSVNDVADQTFTVTPNSGYDIATLVVDSVSVSTSTSYTFSSVTTDHIISATFVAQATPVVTPTVTVGGASYFSHGGSSVQNQVNNLMSMGNPQAAEALMKQYPAQFPNQPVQLPSPIFTHNLSLKNTSNDVQLLQNYLNTHGFIVAKTGDGSLGHETNYFGSATKAALIKFQKANNILPATGDLGPRTRALLNNLSVTTTVSTSLPTQSSPVNTNTPSFTRDLEKGMKGDDVKLLQNYLNTHGFSVATSGDGSLGHETTLFGLGTKAALIKFQKANNITPASGYFGVKTQQYILSH